MTLTAEQAARFSHRQALAITGLENAVIQAWFKRGFLVDTSAESDRTKSRGFRRKYSFVDLL